MTQSIERQTLDFGSGDDLRVPGSSPRSGSMLHPVESYLKFQSHTHFQVSLLSPKHDLLVLLLTVFLLCCQALLWFGWDWRWCGWRRVEKEQRSRCLALVLTWPLETS